MSEQRTVDICAQGTGDPDMKAYHTRYEMSEKEEKGARGYEDGLGEFGRLFLCIRGIAAVSVYPYVILVTKAPLFTWEEVTPAVESILKDFIKSQKMLEKHLNAPKIPEGSQEPRPVDGVAGRRPARSRV